MNKNHLDYEIIEKKLIEFVNSIDESAVYMAYYFYPEDIEKRIEIFRNFIRYYFDFKHQQEFELRMIDCVGILFLVIWIIFSVCYFFKYDF